VTRTNPEERFSDRVSDYIKYRPGYPAALFDHLVHELGITPDWIVADVGAGTGILSAEWVRRGHQVFGVEPNTPMREAAEELLKGETRYACLDGSAEHVGLPIRSIDLIVAGQAFHWFKPTEARAEFQRILKPGGWVAIIWNDRRPDSTPFLRAYEEILLAHGIDYADVNHRNVSERQLVSWFAPGEMRVATFDNAQRFDWDGLYGRAMSSSYVPDPGHPKHAAFTNALRITFDAHAEHEQVTFDYDTRMYYGRLE
jgi:SAM-dependent methyltransferase